MFRFSGVVVVGVCASLFVGCAQEADSEDGAQGEGLEVAQEQGCDIKAAVSCPSSELECQLAKGLCWHWTVAEDGDHRRCVRGAGICGEVIHPTDPEAFSPIMCLEGCGADAREDDLAPWK
jgi:hypothetical protein